VISLRKAMDAHQVEDVLASTLSSYRAALAAVSDAGAKACPPAGDDLKASLLRLQERLQADASSGLAGLVTETEQSLEAALRSWADRAAQYHHDKTHEVKQLLILLAAAAGQVGERDERYAKRFKHVTGQLQSAAKLNDLSAMRRSLDRSITELHTCVTGMTKDGQTAVTELRTQLATYEARLEEVEHLASIDQLTGLANRRKVERQLSVRIAQGLPFSVIYLDLNGFKQVNDTMGHLAGDDLLRQFAGELKSAFRPADLVGRWGGDEFIVMVEGAFQQAHASTERIDKWVNGEYTLTTNHGPRKVVIKAALGIASWQHGQTLTEVLQLADAAMYRHKVETKKT
jgi:diguanylate cyclase (GGDEF)-like protein